MLAAHFVRNCLKIQCSAFNMLINLRAPTFIAAVLYGLTSFALEPEQVLGEYWKDPLFGEAAAEQTIEIEVLNQRLWPEQVRVPVGKKLRFVATNKSDELHLLAFAAEPAKLMQDSGFQTFLNDEVYHARLTPVVNGQHQHASTNVDDAKSMLKTLSERPTIIVRPNEFKEVLIRFQEAQTLIIFCALDEHRHEGYLSTLHVE